jgi:hypothetical protein
LFKENEYEIDRSRVRQLYGGGDVQVTPESLQQINSSKQDLKRFRDGLEAIREGTIKKRLSRRIAQNFSRNKKKP